MNRPTTLLLFLLLATTASLASDPGSPLDCSDWAMEPGFTCETITTTCGLAFCRNASASLAIPGGQYVRVETATVAPFEDCNFDSTDSQQVEVRLGNGDLVGSVRSRCYAHIGEIVSAPAVIGTGGGGLLLWYTANQSNPGGPTDYVNTRVLVVIRGFGPPAAEIDLDALAADAAARVDLQAIVDQVLEQMPARRLRPR